MMSKEFLDKIATYLGRFETELKSFNDLDLYDYNKHAENTFIPILSLVYGVQLVNKNADGNRNFPAIDLADDARRVAFQITGSTGLDKVKDTLTTFAQHKLYNDFDTLYILMIAQKQSRYKQKALEGILPTGYDFDVKRNIIDLGDIRAKIGDITSLDTLQAIADICERQFSDKEHGIAISGVMGVEELRDIVSGREGVSALQLQERFEVASIQLSQYGNTFDGLPLTHIERGETGELIRWLATPLQKDAEPVHLLVGEPGGGKSVILKDCYDKLSAEGWVVLAFKADRYRVSSLQQLHERANLPEPLEFSVRHLLQEGKKVAVLIDQIDAVSQSVTSQRDCVDTYSQLIYSLKKIAGVRIIVSIRRFELTYDYEFSEYRGKYQRTLVKPLTRADVESIFEHLGLAKEALSNSLYELLSVPAQLNVFCKIQKRAGSGATFTTLQDLYAELWRQQVEEQVAIDGVEQTLFTIANLMHDSQSLSLPASQHTDSPALNHLRRNGLVIDQAGALQFFHQTFYDYCFARSFLKSGRSVVGYLKDEEQSIFVRASLQMILGFLRRQSHPAYIKLLSRLLFGHWVRWHLKALVLNMLSYEDSPTQNEIKFTERHLLKGPLSIYFLEAIRGKAWLAVLLRNGVMERLLHPVATLSQRLLKHPRVLKFQRFLPQQFRHVEPTREHLLNIWFQMLRINLPHNRTIVLEYLDGLADFENKAGTVLNLLHSLKEWDSDLAKKVFVDNARKMPLHSSARIDLLEDAADYDPDWALEQFKATMMSLFGSKEFPADSMYDHGVETISKELIEHRPAQFFGCCLDVVRLCIKREPDLADDNEKPDDLIGDAAFALFDYDRSEHAHGKDWFLHKAIELAETLCTQSSSVFEGFLKSMMQERSTTVIRIALAAAVAEPQNFRDDLYCLLVRLTPLRGFQESHLAYHIRNLLPTLFPILSDEQKMVLSDLILDMKVAYEIEVFEYKGKRSHFNGYGRSVYGFLAAIPRKERDKLPAVKRRFAELERKFGQVKNDPPHRISVYSPSAPLPCRLPLKLAGLKV